VPRSNLILVHDGKPVTIYSPGLIGFAAENEDGTIGLGTEWFSCYEGVLQEAPANWTEARIIAEAERLLQHWHERLRRFRQTGIRGTVLELAELYRTERQPLPWAHPNRVNEN
jgi:hypothetical protein